MSDFDTSVFAAVAKERDLAGEKKQQVSAGTQQKGFLAYDSQTKSRKLPRLCLARLYSSDGAFLKNSTSRSV